MFSISLIHFSSAYMPEPHTMPGTTPTSPPDSCCSRIGLSILHILSFPDNIADNNPYSCRGSGQGKRYQTLFPQAEMPEAVYKLPQRKAVLSGCHLPHPYKPRPCTPQPSPAAGGTASVSAGMGMDDLFRLHTHLSEGSAAPALEKPDAARSAPTQA